MKPKRIEPHHGKFKWRAERNNVGVVWGWWTFRGKPK